MPGTRIGQHLLQLGLINETQLEEALALQRHYRRQRVGEVLVEFGSLSEAALSKVLETGQATQPLGERLVAGGLVTRQDLERALLVQRDRRHQKLGEVLVHLGALSEASLIQALSRGEDEACPDSH